MKKKQAKDMHEDLKDTVVDEIVGGAIGENGESSDQQDLENGMTREIDKLKSELDEQRDTVLRVSAEFQNFKRRMEKEKSDVYKFANEKLILEILPVMDNFERALQVIEVEDNSKIKDGLDMIKKGLEGFFTKNGIEAIPTENADFDPNLHQAVLVEPCEGVEPDKIIQELQKGYTLNGRVIRPAMVKVSN